MEILEKLFGSLAKVKIMKLFIFNPEKYFDKSDIGHRTKVLNSAVRSEIINLEKMGLIKQKSFFKEVTTRGGETRKKRVDGWILDDTFRYLAPLHSLMLYTAPVSDSEIVSRLARAGKMKLIITTGVFIQSHDSRIDMLVVGDRLNIKLIERVMKNMESEIGRELRFVVLETDEYKYRLGVYDKLVRDILDFPHEKLLDKLGVEV